MKHSLTSLRPSLVPGLLAALFALALLAVFAAPANAQTDTSKDPYTIDPTVVRADEGFDLHLLSHRFTCGTTYGNQSVEVDSSNGRITLSFLPTSHPEVACPAVYMPYGPTFAMRPLPTGTYSVYAVTLLPCMVSEPRCEIAVVPEFAGTLTVGHDSGWILQPKQVTENKAFTMSLLSFAYGNCQTEFLHEKLELSQGALYATFAVEQYPDRVCVADIRPFGPSFDAPGYSQGKYPVYAIQQPTCMYSATPCPTVFPQPVFVDTLRVLDPSGIKTGERNGSGRVMVPEAPAMPGTIQGYRPDGRRPVTTVR